MPRQGYYLRSAGIHMSRFMVPVVEGGGLEVGQLPPQFSLGFVQRREILEIIVDILILCLF